MFRAGERDSIIIMITTKEIENIANLSRIKLTEEDKKTLVKDFDAILEYVDKLKKADVSMDAEGRVGAVRNVSREDKAVSSSDDDRKILLDEVPDREGDFVAVKKVIEQ